MRRYTNDVIASAGFGLQVNSLKDRDNEFYRTGQELFQLTSLQRAYLFLSAQFPNVAKVIMLMGLQPVTITTVHNVGMSIQCNDSTFISPNITLCILQNLGCQMIPEKTTSFFKNLVVSTIEYRLKNNIKRPDMIQMLMEASKGRYLYRYNLVLSCFIYQSGQFI